MCSRMSDCFCLVLFQGHHRSDFIREAFSQHYGQNCLRFLALLSSLLRNPICMVYNPASICARTFPGTFHPCFINCCAPRKGTRAYSAAALCREVERAPGLELHRVINNQSPICIAVFSGALHR